VAGLTESHIYGPDLLHQARLEPLLFKITIMFSKVLKIPA